MSFEPCKKCVPQFHCHLFSRFNTNNNAVMPLLFNVQVHLLGLFSFSTNSLWVWVALFNVVAEGNNKCHSIKRAYVSHNTFSRANTKPTYCYQPFWTRGAVIKRWFIPLTTNLDVGLGGGFIDFQKALAFSMVSAELPENSTVDISAILFSIVSRDARLLSNFAQDHQANSRMSLKATELPYKWLTF